MSIRRFIVNQFMMAPGFKESIPESKIIFNSAALAIIKGGLTRDWSDLIL